MQIAYWIIAVLLGVLYLFAGASKLVRSQEQLQPMMAWAGTTIPMWGVRLIGLVEVLGVVGLIGPPWSGIAPVFALIAALGFAVLQIPATALHIKLGETNAIGLNIGLFVLAAVEVWLATSFL